MKSKLLFLIMLICTLCISTEIYGDEILPRNWYICYPNSTCINEYSFTDDGKVIESKIDGYGNTVSSTERFTYEVGDNKIIFNSIAMDGSADHAYVIDAGEYAFEIVDNVMHLAYPITSSDNVEWYLYPSIDLAIEYSDTYKYTDEYISTRADKYGFVIRDGVLEGYFGDAVEIHVPEIVHTIGTHAFMSSDIRAANLKKVIVPGSVKKIEPYAFAYSNVKTVYMEEGVEEIGDNCFSDSEYTDIYFPESVKTIGDYILSAVFFDSEIVNDELIVHCVKNSVAWNYFKDYTPNDAFTCMDDYDKYNQNDDNGLRQSSIVLIIASAVCIVGLIAYAVIKFMSVKRRKRVS